MDPMTIAQIASMAYGMYKGGTQKSPEYELSPEQQKYYDELMKIYSGKSELTDPSMKYTAVKDRILPEYERLQKEYDVYRSRRGIQGGPETAFRQRMGGAQVEDLTRAYQDILAETDRMRFAALQGMGGIGQQTTEGRYGHAMQQYLSGQQAYSDLIGTAGSYLYDQYGNRQRRSKGKGVESPYIGVKHKSRY